MTLGYFLEVFLGFKEFVVGNTKGAMGPDWWVVKAEFLDEEIGRISRHSSQAEKSIELLVFKIEKDGECTLFHPWIMESDDNILELTHIRPLESQDKIFVRALRNGKPPELPFLTVEQLREVARKRLTQ